MPHTRLCKFFVLVFGLAAHVWDEIWSGLFSSPSDLELVPLGMFDISFFACHSRVTSSHPHVLSSPRLPGNWPQVEHRRGGRRGGPSSSSAFSLHFPTLLHQKPFMFAVWLSVSVFISKAQMFYCKHVCHLLCHLAGGHSVTLEEQRKRGINTVPLLFCFSQVWI